MVIPKVTWGKKTDIQVQFAKDSKESHRDPLPKNMVIKCAKIKREQ